MGIKLFNVLSWVFLLLNLSFQFSFFAEARSSGAPHYGSEVHPEGSIQVPRMGPPPLVSFPRTTTGQAKGTYVEAVDANFGPPALGRKARRPIEQGDVIIDMGIPIPRPPLRMRMPVDHHTGGDVGGGVGGGVGATRSGIHSGRDSETTPGQGDGPDEEEDKYAKSSRSLGGRFYAYAVEPLLCTGEECGKDVKFCLNPQWCRPTVRRTLGVLGVGALGAGAGYLMWQFGPGVFNNLIKSVGAFVVINGGETALSLAALFMSTPPGVPKTSIEKLRELAVIIPVHGREKDISKTLRSILDAGIAYDQVFVIDNSGGRYTKDESKASKTIHLSREFEGVHYYFINEWGSKVAAEFLGAVAAKRAGFKSIMTIDDDVILPKGFDPYLALLDGEVKLIAYPIKPSNNTNYLTRMQKREYRRADRHNYFKYVLGTILSPHGAISVADVDAYLDVMRRPPVDGSFFAEDQKKGAAFRYKRLGHNYKIAMAPGEEVKTEVPNNWATFWSQRVGSWDTGAHLSCSMYAEDMATDVPEDCSCNQITGCVVRKAYQSQNLFTLFSDCARPVLMVSLSTDWFFWAVIAGVWEANNLIDILDETICVPHRKGDPICESGKVVSSCLDHHLSVPYSMAQLVNGSCGACCAHVGAGAGSPDEYFIRKPYPPEMKELLQIENPDERFFRLCNYLERISAIQDEELAGASRPGLRDHESDDLSHLPSPSLWQIDQAGQPKAAGAASGAIAR